MSLNKHKIIPLIESYYHTFTPLERTIADFFIHNTEEQDFSSKNISGLLYVSEASLSRFAQKCGFHGYREFIYEYKQSLAPGPEENIPNFEVSEFNTYQELLNKSNALLDKAQITRITNLLVSKPRVYVYGRGSSGLVAQEMKLRFMRIGLNIEAVTDSHIMKVNSVILDENCLVIGISVSGQTEEVIHSLKAAKAQGVKTAETIWQARRKCPALLLLPAHHDKYRYYSRLAGEIYRRYTDLVEPFGIDESWLDVTGTLGLFGGDPAALADQLREEMKRELGLTISVGVSFNKVFAKLGSDYKKPDATTVISREQVPQILWPLPVTDLLFVGRASARMLAEHHIHTIGDLARARREDLKKWLGKHGEQLHDAANGWDHSPVRPAGETPPPKSVGNGLTFRRNLTGAEEIQAGAQLLAERVALRLRRHQLKCTTVQVSLRSPEFKTIQRQKGTPAPTNVSRVIFQCVVELLEGTWNWSAPLRAMTITAAGLVPEEEAGEQLDLFTPQAAVRRGKQEKLERTMDALRDRYGPHVIGYASRQTQTAQEIAGDETGKRKEESP